MKWMYRYYAETNSVINYGASHDYDMLPDGTYYIGDESVWEYANILGIITTSDSTRFDNTKGVTITRKGKWLITML